MLIKNLEGGFQSRLQEIYRNLDIPPEGLANIAWAEDRARRREIKFVSEVALFPNFFEPDKLSVDSSKYCQGAGLHLPDREEGGHQGPSDGRRGRRSP